MITIYNIKKWIKMLSGDSLLHVNQGNGKCYSVSGPLKGYYNDLTEKVTKDPETLDSNEPPKVELDDGRKLLFPVTVIQYGLGAYDMYILEKKDIYLKKFHECCNWVIKQQKEDGSIDAELKPDKEHYSAMIQGECASLLLRCYELTKNQEYVDRAKKAIDFMLKPISAGGTAEYIDDRIVLYEFTYLPPVLNGWIFSLFGLYDLTRVVSDEKYTKAFNECVNTIRLILEKYDRGYWSNYDLGGKIASPFYHNLHVGQLIAMYKITEDTVYKDFAKKWQEYQKNRAFHIRAFIVKAIQKIKEP